MHVHRLKLILWDLKTITTITPAVLQLLVSPLHTVCDIRAWVFRLSLDAALSDAFVHSTLLPPVTTNVSSMFETILFLQETSQDSFLLSFQKSN